MVDGILRSQLASALSFSRRLTSIVNRRRRLFVLSRSRRRDSEVWPKEPLPVGRQDRACPRCMRRKQDWGVRATPTKLIMASVLR